MQIDLFFCRMMNCFHLINQAAAEFGTGPRGTPLHCGYSDYHIELESELAKLKKKEVYTCQHMINVGRKNVPCAKKIL